MFSLRRDWSIPKNRGRHDGEEEQRDGRALPQIAGVDADLVRVGGEHLRLVVGTAAG